MGAPHEHWRYPADRPHTHCYRACATWPHSANWGYYPSGGVGLILIIVEPLVLSDRI
ncbi:DUF3309 domain-containing protein [Telmatospirillum sp.]|uniref:DUF3309 domain-containing protein n=1 Tax=Telmatospirillum sp. TaxID=2079197 RepID=UPI002852A2BB|nr:DUF3309 domain-containing protein [Telmatospirillum sp.]